MQDTNIEITRSLKIIDLLNQYNSDPKEKKQLLQEIYKLNPISRTILEKENYSPTKLAVNLQKAIELYEYKPKHLDMILFATSKDLPYIKGTHSVYDVNLSKMLKNNTKTQKIQKAFKIGMANIDIMSDQFTSYWFDLLNKHKILANRARNSDKDTEIYNYDKLFSALSKDFCKKHKCSIKHEIVKKWSNIISDAKDTNGIHRGKYSFEIQRSITEKEANSLIQKLKSAIKAKSVSEDFPNIKKSSTITINITNIKKHYKNNFFYAAICTFIHEIQHALDFQHPEQGILGEQIKYIDSKIYTDASVDLDLYHNSATEQSSKAIELKLFNLLTTSRF